MIDELFRSVPPHLLNESGTVFYSGRDAFSHPSRLYLLGLNPGGSPSKQEGETLSWHSNRVLHKEPNNWSAYRNESWEGVHAGKSLMQRRVLYLLEELGFDPGSVPSSNLIFVRSAGEEGLKGRKRELADTCWAFHERVINTLDIKVILCFGKFAGERVQKKLGAGELVETVSENNSSGWESQSFRNTSGTGVVIATHPSRFAWNPAGADPTQLVKHLLTSSAMADRRSR